MNDTQLTAAKLREWQSGPCPKPTKRIACVGCRKRLSIELEDVNTFEINLASINAGTGKPKRNYTGRWKYRSEGHFHSQTCAANWANKEVDKLLK